MATRTIALSFSSILPRRSTATAAGTNVSDRMSAATKAMITASAIGRNIFPSTPTRARMGKLTRITTSTLTRLGIYIHIAKITTKGDEAADIFYIKDIFGQKIFYDARLKEISDGLYSAIEGSAFAGEDNSENPGS